MAKQTVAQLKAWFRKGLKPTEEQFAALLDSYVHKDDEIDITKIKGLVDLLNKKYDKAMGEALQQKVADLEEIICAESNDLGALREFANKLAANAVLNFAGVVYHESEANGKTPGDVYYAHAEGYFVEVTEDGIKKAGGLYNKSDRIGSSVYGNEDMLYRQGGDLYKLVNNNMVKYALTSEMVGGDGESIDLSNYVTHDSVNTKLSQAIEALKGGELTFATLKEIEDVIFEESERLASVLNDVVQLKRDGGKGIIVVDAVQKAADVENGQFVGVYTPNTKFTSKKITEIGMAIADADGYLADVADAKAVNTFEIGNIELSDWITNDGMVTYKPIVELTFSSADGMTKTVITFDSRNNGATLDLVHKHAGVIDGYYLGSSVKESFGEHYLTSYVRKVNESNDSGYNNTLVQKTVTIGNYYTEFAEMEQWSDGIVLSGGTDESLAYYHKTSRGLEAYKPFNVYTANWGVFSSGELEEMGPQEEGMRLLKAADLIIINGSVVSDCYISDDAVFLQNVKHNYGNAIVTRDYRVTASGIYVTNEQRIELGQKGLMALSLVFESLTQSSINVSKPFFVDVTIGSVYYTEYNNKSYLTALPLYLSEGSEHPQTAEIWHQFACKTNSRTRIKCEPIVDGLWEVTIVSEDGNQSKKWLDLNGVTSIGLLSYTRSENGDQNLQFETEGNVIVNIYQ
ncbi:MAG: hypothetical protein IKZ14_07640 [Muribaculaceae bacterium]|nr:hypothetical protein [Muribaculaceae bacterium]